LPTKKLQAEAFGGGGGGGGGAGLGLASSLLLTLHKTQPSPSPSSPLSDPQVPHSSIAPCWCPSNSVVDPCLLCKHTTIANTPILASCSGSAHVPPKMGPNAAKRSAKCVNACNHCRIKKIKCTDDLARQSLRPRCSGRGSMWRELILTHRPRQRRRALFELRGTIALVSVVGVPGELTRLSCRRTTKSAYSPFRIVAAGATCGKKISFSRSDFREWRPFSPVKLLLSER
jgi:hypothetical protein